MLGMPSWMGVLRAARMVSSFWAAAAMVVSIAAISPSQPCSFASASRSTRLAWISSSRVSLLPAVGGCVVRRSGSGGGDVSERMTCPVDQHTEAVAAGLRRCPPCQYLSASAGCGS